MMSFPFIRSTFCALTLAAVLSLGPREVTTAQTLTVRPLISASLYPAHSRIVAMPGISNRQMDCDWGFQCSRGQDYTRVSLFHLSDQDALRRISGWAQLARSTVAEGQMLFSVFGSRYSLDAPEAPPWNVRAFMDFRAALRLQGYQDLDPVPRLAPREQIANQGLQELRAGKQDIVAMTCWTGAIEVEGVVAYRHGSNRARQVAIRDLTHQMRAAVRLTMGQTG